jgi:hypothetical protein
MAHFFNPDRPYDQHYDETTRTPLAPNAQLPIGLWAGGADLMSRLRLVINPEKPSCASIRDGARGFADKPDVRYYTVTGLQAGTVNIEARLGEAGSVLARMSLVVGSTVDSALLKQTSALVNRFDAAIARLTYTSLKSVATGHKGDLRLLFTHAHAYITRSIRKHIGLFAAPNPLMRLNALFATTFLNALEGAPDAAWQYVFKVCAGAGVAAFPGLIATPAGAAQALVDYEECAMCMASVHIKRDLRDALRKVRDVNAQDYGNVLVFVQEGFLHGETQIRGSILGNGEVWVGKAFEPLGVSAKKWRNDVFKEVYGINVPEPSRAFVTAYQKGWFHLPSQDYASRPDQVFRHG